MQYTYFAIARVFRAVAHLFALGFAHKHLGTGQLLLVRAAAALFFRNYQTLQHLY